MNIVISRRDLGTDTQLINSFNSNSHVILENNFATVDNLINHINSLNVPKLGNICLFITFRDIVHFHFLQQLIEILINIFM